MLVVIPFAVRLMQSWRQQDHWLLDSDSVSVGVLSFDHHCMHRLFDQREQRVAFAVAAVVAATAAAVDRSGRRVQPTDPRPLVSILSG